MRIVCLIVLLLLGESSVFAQASKAIAMEDKAFSTYFLKRGIPKANGRIINLTKEEIANTKIEYTLVTPLQQLQVTKICTLNPDGSFELKLDYAFPYQQVWIDVDHLFYTGVYVNTDLFIELDAALLKTREEAEFNGTGVKYQGQDGAFNEYTANHMLFKRQEQLDISSKLQMCLVDRSKDYAAFIKTSTLR